MNKIWKSFFSKKLGLFVVASENARSSTKSKKSITVAVATVGITFSAGVFANEVINSTGSHTKGSYVYNLELASKRTDTVFTNLVKHGVDPKIIEINNLGKSQSFNERKVQITW